MTDSVPPAPDTDPPPPARDAAAPASAPLEGEWHALPPAARTVWMGGSFALGLPFGVLFWLVLVLPSVDGWAPRLALLVAIPVALAALCAWVAWRRWRSTRWRLDARGLQVRRGRMFQSEVLVPRSRVQHLDLERGPIERHYGLATIVVHTAGTRLQALRQSGLADADAVALRDALVPEAELDGDAD